VPQPVEDLASAKAAIVQRVINSICGSYGDLLMVGVPTSPAGLALVDVGRAAFIPRSCSRLTVSDVSATALPGALVQCSAKDTLCL
jgi:hypothetical protein